MSDAGVGALLQNACRRPQRWVPVLIPATTPPFTNGPRFVLKTDDTAPLAAVWFPDPAHMVVRAAPDAAAAVVGHVEARWERDAIRLVLTPAEGAPIETGMFQRIDGRVAPTLLGQLPTTGLEVRGVYRAAVNDSAGTSMGWLRVQISPYQPAQRIYDGALQQSTAHWRGGSCTHGHRDRLPRTACRQRVPRRTLIGLTRKVISGPSILSGLSLDACVAD